MKKLDLWGGKVLRQLIENFYEEKTNESLSCVLACLRDSEVWIPIGTDFCAVDSDNTTSSNIQAKHLEIYPFVAEYDDGDSFLTAYSYLTQMKKLKDKDNVIKLSFLECMQWALSLNDIDGIVLDTETRPFYVLKEDFGLIAEIPSTLEDEYIYAKVRFSAGGKGFYYETLRKDLDIGDRVVVPFGKNDKEKVGTIIEIEKYDSDNLPHSYFSTKYILRKACEKERVYRKELTERVLLQEQESYDIIKKLIEEENEFSFEKYYNDIFAMENRINSDYWEWNNAGEGEITKEQRDKLLEKLEGLFDELDDIKPLFDKNSLGEHYANELFYKCPKYWGETGESFLWAYLARKFSAIRLPISKEEFTQLFNQFTCFIELPEERYLHVELAEFSYNGLSRNVHWYTKEHFLKTLLKNLQDFNAKMAELESKEVFTFSAKQLVPTLGKTVRITRLNGSVVSGTAMECVAGSNGFIVLKINTKKGEKKITIDDISALSIDGEEIKV